METIENKTKLIISTDLDSYGVTTEENIKVVQSRIEHVARAMDYEIEYVDFTQVPYDDFFHDHDINATVFDACMECSNTLEWERITPGLKDAVEDAIKTIPLVPNDLASWAHEHDTRGE